jgi:hypothetical protein
MCPCVLLGLEDADSGICMVTGDIDADAAKRSEWPSEEDRDMDDEEHEKRK